MTSSEKFCLKWNDFQQNISTAYKDIRDNADFSDVTLMCEDDQQVEAHRVILSACSPFFMKVLKKNKHPNPMIYMRGLNAKDLNAIVDFIYHGEANIYQDDLDVFMSLAEELQLKGLSGNPEDEKEKLCDRFSQEEKVQKLNDYFEKVEKGNTYRPSKLLPKQKPMRENNVYPTTTKEEVIDNSSENYGTVAVPDNNTTKIIVENVDDLDEQISTIIRKLEGSGEWICTVCGKASKNQGNIRQHIEANHIEGMEHPCDQCGKVSRSRHALARHIFLNHKM